MPDSSLPPSDSTEGLAFLLDRLESAHDAVTAAHKHKAEVTREIRAALGMTDGYTSDDKLTASLLRALVKARQNEREGDS